MRDLWWCEVCGSRDAPYSDPYLSPPPAPSSPFDLAQPNVFSELLTQIQQNPCGFSGGGTLTVGFLHFTVWHKKKEKKKRHTLNFLASILTRISPVDDTARVSNMPVWFRAHDRSVSEYSRIRLFSLQPAACSLKWILRDSWNQSP